MKPDEALGPGDLALFGARGELADTAGPTEAVEPARRRGETELANVQEEDIAVEERESGVGLFQAGQRALFCLGDMFEEAGDVGGRQVAWVAFVVEEDEVPSPVDAAFSRPLLAESRRRDVSDEVEEARRLG
jgi:hypothetical protein